MVQIDTFFCQANYSNLLVSRNFAVVIRDRTMADKMMCIYNDVTKNYPSVDYKQWFRRLDTQLNEPTIQN